MTRDDGAADGEAHADAGRLGGVKRFKGCMEASGISEAVPIFAGLFRFIRQKQVGFSTSRAAYKLHCVQLFSALLSLLAADGLLPALERPNRAPGLRFVQAEIQEQREQADHVKR